MTRYKLFRVIFFDKKEFIFLNWAFLGRNCNILPDFQSSFNPNLFRIRRCSDLDDFFRIGILLKVADPTVSATTTLLLFDKKLKIKNTETKIYFASKFRWKRQDVRMCQYFSSYYPYGIKNAETRAVTRQGCDLGFGSTPLRNITEIPLSTFLNF